MIRCADHGTCSVALRIGAPAAQDATDQLNHGEAASWIGEQHLLSVK